MLCQLCKKREATVCINVDMNGVKNQQFICEVCAEEHKLRENPSGDAILKLLNEIKKADSEREAKKESELPDITCNICGTKYRDFDKYGLLGCENCYEAFAEQLKPLMESLSVPNESHADTSKKPNELMLLQLQLKRCIENENYEEAASLRDKINALREKNSYGEDL